MLTRLCGKDEKLKQQTQSRTEEEVDLDKPLICNIQWWDIDNSTLTDCTNIATWSADCHDERDHDSDKLVLCGECLIVAKYKKDCPECGGVIITNLRKL